MSGGETVIALGLGNILAGDDGFGVHVIQHLQENYTFPGRCRVIDGGTQGQLLYGIVEDANRLLLVDAADFGLEAGVLALHGHEEIPVWLGAGKLGAHQGSFAEVLALAALKNILPAEIWLIGFQPLEIGFGRPLSAAARAAVAPACGLALDCLATWGVFPVYGGARQDAAAREVREAFA